MKRLFWILALCVSAITAFGQATEAQHKLIAETDKATVLAAARVLIVSQNPPVAGMNPDSFVLQNVYTVTGVKNKGQLVSPPAMCILFKASPAATASYWAFFPTPADRKVNYVASDYVCNRAGQLFGSDLAQDTLTFLQKYAAAKAQH